MNHPDFFKKLRIHFIGRHMIPFKYTSMSISYGTPPSLPKLLLKSNFSTQEDVSVIFKQKIHVLVFCINFFIHFFIADIQNNIFVYVP
jgi:hypothetical protein